MGGIQTQGGGYSSGPHMRRGSFSGAMCGRVCQGMDAPASLICNSDNVDQGFGLLQRSSGNLEKK